jgi:hypothetical protein
LAEIGFGEEGRYFTHPETEYFLEFPAGPLAVGGEPPQRIVVLGFETGDLAALSPTDCVKDRLAAYFHWNDQQCLEQALLVACASDIDLAEIKRWSFKEDAFTRKPKSGWLSKKRQMQGAQLSRNEAYLGTPQ